MNIAPPLDIALLLMKLESYISNWELELENIAPADPPAPLLFTKLEPLMSIYPLPLLKAAPSSQLMNSEFTISICPFALLYTASEPVWSLKIESEIMTDPPLLLNTMVPSFPMNSELVIVVSVAPRNIKSDILDTPSLLVNLDESIFNVPPT
ncbi:hypothetical protein MBBWO_12480 [Methanobrevibacter woesei]|uniref:Uncharacterized protein n=1 Tax=Methanobrevibacter woesei TaxID=190976 RepID=A0A2U1S8F1_9EURY|nr:hypothetical protein MBBWO_12480 [Methanobrevibacter woesei]